MKRLMLVTVLLTAVFGVMTGQKVTAKGETFTAMGEFTVVAADNPVALMGQDCQVFNIRYDNSPLVVKVIICKDRKCRKYLVLSDKLSVQYVCNKDYFGIERLNKTNNALGYETSDENLNRFEYFHQKVLGPGQKTVDEATRLIAAYFPYLLKNEDLTTAMN